MLKSLIPITKSDKFVVEIYISHKCNYDCDYCPLHVNGIKFNEIDFKKLLSFSHPEGYDVYIYGGEPLIHPQLFDLLNHLGKERKIVLQTNLSAKPEIILRILEEHNNVVFSLSYHYKYADFKKFLTNTKLISNANKLHEVSVMWISDHDDKIYKVYKIFKSLYNDRTWLQPTLPNKDSLDEWILKTEIHLFLRKYLPSITNFRHELLIDGKKKTMLEAYADNDDLNICGIRCYINKHRITYDGHTNEWRYCTADVVYREVSSETCHRTFGCAADLGYEKHFENTL